MREEIKYRQEVHFGKLLHEHGYVAATNGNLSVRLDGQLLLVTPTSVSKGMLRLQDLIVVDMGGAFRDDFTRYETARTRALAKRRGDGTAERATAAQI